MARTRVAVLYGGRSTEHAISCVSAGSVLAALDPDRYEPVPIGITAQGRWVLGTADPSELAIVDGRLPAVTGGPGLALPADPTIAELIAVDDGAAALGAVDVVFPVLHGPYGEDGTVQGLLELADLPYVGSGVLASAAAMDKAVAKVLLRHAGLPVAPSVVARQGRTPPDVSALTLPLFVKPSRGGSSIGISRVTDLAELPRALETAFASDPKVLVEQGIAGREVELGVLDGPDGPQVSVPAEVRLTGASAFYDFEAKYLDGATALDVPADLPGSVVARLQDLSLAAFEALDCEGLARVDFFVPESGEPLLNEVNTMPGFTPSSMFPRMWAASGVAYPELVDRLIQAALRRPKGLR